MNESVADSMLAVEYDTAKLVISSCPFPEILLDLVITGYEILKWVVSSERIIVTDNRDYWG